MLNLTNNESELPYIIFPENNLKVLIDTGSTRSFILPEIANKYFKKSIHLDPFKISTAHGTSQENFSAKMTTSSIFNLKKPIDLKFCLFKFHDKFECLLGIDNLKKLNITIDLIKNVLITPTAKIKINYYKVPQTTNCIVVPPRTEQIVKINIKNIKNGEILLPYTKISELEIPQCITIVQNHMAICTILNKTEFERPLDLSNSFEAELFDEYEQSLSPNFNSFNTEKIKFDINKIRTEHMNSEEKETVLKLIKEYSDIFHVEGNKLTFTHKIKHEINTSDELPVYTRSYRYPEVHRKEVQKQIQNMLDQNIIRPSTSPWCSSIWVVSKKPDASGQQKWRIVVDYRRLNEKTIGNSYPLPLIDALLDKLGRSQYFSTLDLASGFHQIQIAEKDIPKTAFNTENGHYEFLRMGFGLKGAPATFQRIMDSILRGIQNETCLVYLDDIIIFSTSLQEHITRLKEVFSRLRDANLKLQLDKCEFLRKEVTYLGHVITPEGVKPNPEKIKAIKKYPIPKNTTQLKGFLGLLGYYRKFIKDFSKIALPLTKRLKKGVEINPKDLDYSECFEYCKTLLVNEPILQYPDFSQPFILTTDASNHAIGAVLSQGKIGSDLPVAYASRTLNKSECSYSTIEKEMLAIVWAVKYFRPYLFGRKFKIYSDHRPLQWLFSLKEPNSKLVRWRLKLAEYEYEIIYKKGSLNKNCDALSRIQLNLNEAENEKESSSAIFDFIEDFNKSLDPEKSESLIVEAEDDKDSENEVDDNETVHTNLENPVAGIPIVDCPVNFGKNQVIISEVNYEPAPPTTIKLYETKQRLLIQLSKNDFENDAIKFLKEFIVPKVKYYLYFEDPVYEKLSVVIQTHFKNSMINMIKCTKKLIDVDLSDIKEIIKNYHESKTNHRGLDETESRIKNTYYWPNQRKSIQTYINECEICLLTKYDRNPIKTTFNLTPTATKPFQIIHMDSITLEGTKFLTLVDSFSKYGQMYKMKSAEGIETVNNLIKYFTHHCVPTEIISDNGTELKNSLVKELLQLHKINIHFISSQHPESNGIAERFHSTIIEHIRLLNLQNEYKKDPIEQKVNYALLAYNNTVHSVTKLKPFEIITGNICNNSALDIDIEQQLVNDYVSKHKEKIKLVYSEINKNIQKSKEKVIEKANKNREEMPKDIPTRVFMRNRQKQNKTKPKYQVETIRSINKTKKTAKINPRHGNTAGDVHLSNIKRPRKKPYVFISDSSPSDKE